MSTMTPIDVFNGITHLAFLIGYVVIAVTAIKTQREDEINFDLSTPSRIATHWAGATSLVIGAIMAGFWIYFISKASGSFMAKPFSVKFHAGIELAACLMLIFSGVAMFRMWTYAIGLYLISTLFLITSTIFSKLYYGAQGHPFAMDIIGFSAATLLILVGGLAFTMQYFYLLDQVKRQDQA